MNIYESITAIQADIDFIGKDKVTQSGSRYKYRGVDQVLNTLHPLFAKHKVFAVPEVLEILNREWRTTTNGGTVVYQTAKVRYTFYAEDGTNVSAVVIGEAMDSSDKASNKCMSVAYKYACFQMLSIPTEETTADPDDTTETFADSAKSSDTAAKTSGEGNHSEELKNSPQAAKAALRKAWTREILVGEKQVRLGDLPAETLKKYSEKTKDKSLRDDMLRVMQHKFVEAAKAETADLPFKDVGSGNAEG